MGSDQFTIANRLKEARSRRGFRSARSFSKYNGFAESTYAQHESGKRKLNIETLLIYSQKLSIEPEWLLTGEEPFSLTAVDNSKTKDAFIQANQSELEKKYLLANVKTLTRIVTLLLPSIASHKINSYQALITITHEIYANIENDSEKKNNETILEEIHLALNAQKNNPSTSFPSTATK